MPNATATRTRTYRSGMTTNALEVEIQRFQEAIAAYKEDSGRLFPTWSEVLEVLRSLGYEKAAATSA